MQKSGGETDMNLAALLSKITTLLTSHIKPREDGPRHENSEQELEEPKGSNGPPDNDFIQREWGYTLGETSSLFAVLVLVIGVTLAALEPQLATQLRLPDPDIRLSVLGMSLVGISVLSHGLSRLSKRGSSLFLIFGVLYVVLLASIWWPTAEMIQFLPFVLVLAIFRLGAVDAFWVMLAIDAVLLTPTLRPTFAGRPGFLPIFMGSMGTIWIAGFINWYLQSTFLGFLHSAYWGMREQLNRAREHRMVLNQINQELAGAYVEIQRLNKLLQASRMEADAARRAKEDFVANVSHELRTPLNMIIGFTEMIIHSPFTYGSNLPAELVSDIRVIYRNSQHLSQMINDVLDLARVEAGQLVLQYEWVDMYAVMREAVQAISPLYRSKGLQLAVNAPDTDLAAFCDRLRVRQILLNLLSNAGRYTDEGGVTITVRPGEDEIVFNVTDTGRGLSPVDREHIFDPFYQSHDAGKAATGSSGLGLTICKQLVELHGGRIWFEEPAGAGASISFSIQVRRPETAVSPAVGWLMPYRNTELRQHSTMPSLPKPKDRIIVLEKEDTLRSAFAALLPDNDVIGATNVNALQRKMQSGMPTALVVNDAEAMEDNMFSRRLLALPPRIPVISCYLPGKKDAIQNLNVVKYLVKPIVRDELLAVTEQITPAVQSILIVENDLEMALLLRRQLDSAGQGYRIIQVADDSAALHVMRERRPDLVLLDLGMPDQEGYQMLHKIKLDSDIRSIPVIAISARDPISDPVMASRIRVELAGGLSPRDIVRCTGAISQIFSSVHRSENPESLVKLLG